MNLSNKVYDKLKFTVQVLIPGLATLYVAVGQYLTLWRPEAVVGIAAALATFLGLFLTASSKQYEGAGDLVVTHDPEDNTYALHADLNKHPNAFKNKRNVVLNVVHQDVDVPPAA